MEFKKRLTYHVKEYWYMGSIFGKSVIEKNNTEAWAAMGLYPRRDSLILASVSSAI